MQRIDASTNIWFVGMWFTKKRCPNIWPAVVLTILSMGLGTSPAQGQLQAYKVTSSSDLLNGANAAGQVGDYIMENGFITVLISDIGHTGTYDENGGVILDMGTSSLRADALGQMYTYFDDDWPRQAAYSSIAVIDDGSGGGPAVIRVQGVDSIDPNLEVTTDYSLINSEVSYVTITTTVINTGSTVYSDFELGDAFQWGSCEKYAPGYGSAVSGSTSQIWLAGTSDTIYYGYTSPPDTMWGPHGGAWSDVNLTTASLGPGEEATYTRYLVMSSQDLARTVWVIHELWNLPVGAVACSVTTDGGSTAISGAIVEAHDTQDDPYLQMKTDPSGYAIANMSPGDWRLVASALGYGPQETWQTIVLNDTTSHLFILAPEDTVVAPKGDTLTVIQRPLLNIPALVRPGDTLNINCDADPTATGWSARLEHELSQVPLTILSSSYDATTLWWTIKAEIPPVPLYELYDLIVTADGGIADTTWQAVKVIPEFRDDHYFIHITDTHLPTHLFYYESGADTDTSEINDLRAVVDDINIINPEFVLLTGDLVNEGELEDYLNRRYYTRAQKLLTEFEVPVFLTSGNHDIGGWDSTPPPDGTARRDWWRFFGWRRLDDPPPGAPWYTQNYSFDYGPVHYVGLEAYDNYDQWRLGIYGNASFTSGQMDWLDDDLAEASGSISQVLFYHYDFSDQIDLNSLNVEMTLWGHIHYDQGSITTTPYDLATDNVCDGDRAYRLIRVQNGVLHPTETISAGSSGNNLTVQYSPANDGTHTSVTASIDNNQDERFEYSLLRFLMPSGSVSVTGGSLIQVDDSDIPVVCYVAVDIPANSNQSVTVTVNENTNPPESITDLTATLAGDVIHLSWSAVTTDTAGAPITVDHYIIYRNSDPNFSPVPDDSVDQTTGLAYEDATPALKDTGTNHYYVVKAVDDQGGKSSDSNKTGEFDTSLINDLPAK
jgi:hypothetical protein